MVPIQQFREKARLLWLWAQGKIEHTYNSWDRLVWNARNISKTEHVTFQGPADPVDILLMMEIYVLFLSFFLGDPVSLEKKIHHANFNVS